MRIAIIAAMKGELEMLVSELETSKISKVAGFSFHQGSLEGHQLILLLSGIGKVNAAVAASLLIDRYEPDVVLNTGVAGAFSKELKTGDIVISTEVCHHDVDVSSFGRKIGQVPRMPLSYFPDPHLLSEAQSISSPNSSNAVRAGLIVSGDVFVQEARIAERIKQNFPSALATEMEGAAIAQTCHIFNTPFLIIRSISDIIGEDIHKAVFDDSLLLAATNSVNFVRRLLQCVRG